MPESPAEWDSVGAARGGAERLGAKRGRVIRVVVQRLFTAPDDKRITSGCEDYM
jgi:hypothetical protein